ncbi:hypothetical protein SAMN05192534_11960, partial [Alteribacillus persepolensis]
RYVTDQKRAADEEIRRLFFSKLATPLASHQIEGGFFYAFSIHERNA